MIGTESVKTIHVLAESWGDELCPDRSGPGVTRPCHDVCVYVDGKHRSALWSMLTHDPRRRKRVAHKKYVVRDESHWCDVYNYNAAIRAAKRGLLELMRCNYNGAGARERHRVIAHELQRIAGLMRAKGANDDLSWCDGMFGTCDVHIHERQHKYATTRKSAWRSVWKWWLKVSSAYGKAVFYMGRRKASGLPIMGWELDAGDTGSWLLPEAVEATR